MSTECIVIKVGFSHGRTHWKPIPLLNTVPITLREWVCRQTAGKLGLL